MKMKKRCASKRNRKKREDRIKTNRKTRRKKRNQ